MSLPTVTLEGAVGSVDLRFSGAGKAFVRLRVACSDRERDGSGAWVDGPTSWFNLIAFAKQAENIAESIAKGDFIVATGKIKEEEYTLKDSNEVRKTMTILVDSIGPSVRFNVAKTGRAGGDGVKRGTAPASDDQWTKPDAPAVAVEDPWASPPAAADEPPF